jgi:hypothetical protein
MTAPVRSRRTTGFLIALCITINAGLNVVLRNAGPIPGTLVSAVAVMVIAWLIATQRSSAPKAP